MGFGVLFVGYLLSFGFTSGANYVMSILGIIGTIFLFKASKLLGRYTNKFKISGYFAIILSIAYIYNAVLQVMNTYFSSVNVSTFIERLAYISLVSAVFAYNLIMYLAISDIARTAENTRVRVSAQRDIVLMVIYYTFVSLLPLLTGFMTNYEYIISAFVKLVGILWLILSIILVLSAYMRIGLEGENEQETINLKLK